MVVYGDGDDNVWNKPLYHKLGDTPTYRRDAPSAKTNNTESNNLVTNQENNNTATISGNDDNTVSSTIMTENFTDQISFMKLDFNAELDKITKEKKAASEEHASEIKKSAWRI